MKKLKDTQHGRLCLAELFRLVEALPPEGKARRAAIHGANKGRPKLHLVRT
jgi:hypothetical protein